MVRKKPFKIIPVFISELVIILAVFSLSFSFSFADIGQVSFTNPDSSGSVDTTTPSGTVYQINCPSAYNLNEFSFITRINTGSQSVGFYINDVWYATNTISTAYTWFKLSSLNIPCNPKPSFKLISPVSYYERESLYTLGVNATTSEVFVFSTSTSEYHPFVLKLSLPLTLATSSMGSATTTIITENDQLLNFFLLFSIAFMLIVGIVLLFRPFYVRK